MDSIRNNLEIIRETIEKTCAQTGRDPDGVDIMAVTKQVPPEKIERAWELGIRYFGENRVQELLPKIETVQRPIHWNMIGQLQKNKVKYVINTVSCIQSLDRISLADELERQAKKLGITVNVLVQVNIGKEDTKTGVAPEETVSFIKTVSEKYGSLCIEGLMAIAPDVGEEKARPYFERMRQLFEKAGKLNLPRVHMRCLSMGMSGDYAAAVSEGATMVRLGSAIFGGRKQQNPL